jgi:hypothetical protein
MGLSDARIVHRARFVPPEACSECGEPVFAPVVTCGRCEMQKRVKSWKRAYQRGSTIYEIEERSGYSASYIARRLREVGVKMRRRGNPGHSSCGWTVAGHLDCRVAQEMMGGGATDALIAARFNVSKGAVSTAVNRGKLTRPPGWRRAPRNGKGAA